MVSVPVPVLNSGPLPETELPCLVVVPLVTSTVPPAGPNTHGCTRLPVEMLAVDRSVPPLNTTVGVGEPDVLGPRFPMFDWLIVPSLRKYVPVNVFVVLPS